MIEDSIRQVAQTGFPHNQLESKLWHSELQVFSATPQDVLLWKLPNGKAVGEDGCEEWLGLLRKLCAPQTPPWLSGQTFAQTWKTRSYTQRI